MLPQEDVDLVDESDRRIGVASLSSCLHEGLLHRAVAVLVERRGRGILLQRRSKKDRWQPGRWTLSSTGHVRANESYLHAARRELSEELGIRPPLRRVAKFLIPPLRSRGLIEREHVVLFVAVSDEVPTIDTKELEDAVTFTPEQVLTMLGGRKLTQDAKVLLAEYLRLPRNDARPGRTV